jgi:hypothetical protein
MLRPLKCFILLICFLQAGSLAFAQTASPPVAEWAKKLADPADKENKWFYEL